MTKSKNAVTMSELRASPARILRRAEASNRPIVVTERGKPRGILLSSKAHQDWGMLLSIMRGEREALSGKTVPFEQVFAKADKVLTRLTR